MTMTRDAKMRVLALFIAFLFVGGLFFALLGGGK
jgi:hypothetical protein